MTDSRRPAARGGRGLARAIGSLVDLFPARRPAVRGKHAGDPSAAALGAVLDDVGAAAEREITGEWPRVAGRLGSSVGGRSADGGSPAPTSPAGEASAADPQGDGRARPRDLAEADAVRVPARPDPQPIGRPRQTAAVHLGPGGWRYLVDVLGDVLWSVLAAWQVPPEVAATVVRLAWARVLEQRESMDDDPEVAIGLLEAVHSGAIQQILRAAGAGPDPLRFGDYLHVATAWQEYFGQYRGTGGMPDRDEIHQRLITLVRESYVDASQDRTLFRDMLDPPPPLVREAQHQVMAGITT